METDGELGSGAQVRGPSTGLPGQPVYQDRALGPGVSSKTHPTGATNFQPLHLGSEDWSTCGHLGCGSCCGRSKGKRTRRSLDSILPSPLSPPGDFVPPLLNIEGLVDRGFNLSLSFLGLQTQAKGAEVSTDHLKLFLSRRRWQVSLAGPCCCALHLLILQPSLILPFFCHVPSHPVHLSSYAFYSLNSQLLPCPLTLCLP